MKLLCEVCRKEITKNKRTLSQNRYLHKIIGIMADEIGYPHSDLKQLLKDKFGIYHESVNKKTGEVFRVYHSTANLSRKDFADFTEKIIILGNSYGINLMTPEEYFQT